MQTLLRHLLTALGGALLIDTSNTQAFVFGLLCIFFTWAWSLVSKLEWTTAIHVNDDAKSFFKKAFAALVSQGLAALSGYMLANGFEGDPNDPAAVMLFFGNLGASKMGWTQKVMGLKPVLVAVLCSLFSVLGCSCSSFTKGDAKYAGEQIGLAAADTAIIIARMQLAQANADLEAAKHEPGANNNAILAKQLGVIAAQQALNAAERAIAKERARLDAKQPRNVQPTLSSKFNPRGSNAGDRPARLEGRRPTPEVSIPLFAPQVIAALQTR